MLEEFDQFFIPLSQKSCYSADPPPICWRKFGNQNANHNIFFFFWIVKLLKGALESYIVPCKIILIVNSPRN